MKILKWIAKILMIPFILLYMMTISLFVMPLIIAKRHLGYPLYVLAWSIYWCGIWFALIPYIKNYWGYLNNVACWAITGEWRTTSSYIGERIDNHEASLVELFHCKILATYDPSGNHCSRYCKAWF